MRKGKWIYRSTCSLPNTSWRWVVSITPRPLYLRRKGPGTHFDPKHWDDIFLRNVELSPNYMPVTRLRTSNPTYYIQSTCYLLGYDAVLSVESFQACHLLPRWYLARLIWPWMWRRNFPPKRQLHFNGRHCIISQKIVLFLNIAVTSKPTYCV
jgi:hypothetical protein